MASAAGLTHNQKCNGFLHALNENFHVHKKMACILCMQNHMLGCSANTHQTHLALRQERRVDIAGWQTDGCGDGVRRPRCISSQHPDPQSQLLSQSWMTSQICPLPILCCVRTGAMVCVLFKQDFAAVLAVIGILQAPFPETGYQRTTGGRAEPDGTWNERALLRGLLTVSMRTASAEAGRGPSATAKAATR